MIGTVAAVVPAHDEEELLPGCLAALRQAAAAAPAAQVHLLVVADACRDGTARVAAQAGAAVLEIQARNVGAARAAGFRAMLGRLRPGDPAEVWLTTTDADTLVPPGWLALQLAHARQGWDAVVGTVTVGDWSGHPSHVPARFAARYEHGPGPHPHVHGANLGLTAAAYLAAGGFSGVRTAEDHTLVRDLAAAGQRILRTTELPVVTSARTRTRAPHGFGHLLASLA